MAALAIAALGAFASGCGDDDDTEIAPVEIDGPSTTGTATTGSDTGTGGTTTDDSSGTGGSSSGY